jgi:XTP/dITP diphosphohydrolase
MPQLVIGTRNKHKVQEIADRWKELVAKGWSLVDLSGFPDAPEVEEDQDTFGGNAEKKAREIALALKQWVLAEDSGLVVPALGGAPGVQSARYAGKHGDDAANNRKLLAELEGKADRRAHYVCHAVVADPEGNVVARAEGHCHGVLVDSLKGSGGFGYDPLFLVPEFHATFGQLPLVVKQAISHRTRALEGLERWLHKIGG